MKTKCILTLSDNDRNLIELMSGDAYEVLDPYEIKQEHWRLMQEKELIVNKRNN